jgi:hypothetical protein
VRELTQTSLYPHGNCWQTCVACILDLDPEVLPPQAEYDRVTVREDGTKEYGPSYNNALQFYLHEHHGLTYVELHLPEEGYEFLHVAPGTLHMLTGRTVRSDAYGGVRHVVVARDGQMIWDPHPSHAGLIEEIRWAFLVPYPKAWNPRKDPCVCPACKSKAA